MKDALILAPIGRDASVATTILAAHGLSATACDNMAGCVSQFERFFCFVVTEEALLEGDRSQLADWIKSQAAWSDFPVVLLTVRGGPPIDPRLSFLTECAVALERPFGPQALVSAVRSAVRARRRQLEVKNLLDERDRSDERQRLLIRELHHRVKNTLASVQAVLGATARSSSSVDQFYSSFSARLQSLARTHSFLTDDYWQTALLGEMLSAELSPYNEDGRLELSGPEVSLNADQAVPLGMAIHELVTNSVKYGSLSVPKGVLKVDWDFVPDEAEEKLRLAWRESGGPCVSPPTRKGFGSMLFDRVLSSQLQAQMIIDYDPAGLQFVLTFPLKRDRLVPKYQQG